MSSQRDWCLPPCGAIDGPHLLDDCYARPKLLDLYCCEGGASKGHSKWFDVYGVDLFEDYSQKRYPFPSHKGDVIDVLRRLLAGEKIAFVNLRTGEREWLGLKDFAVIVASPPCQRHTAGTRAGDRSKYPDLIGPTRELLIETGLPYVIENVEGAPLEPTVMLCGTMFMLSAVDDDGTKLELRRHRVFESNVPLTPPGPCVHGALSEQVAGVYGGARRDKHEARNERHGGYVPPNKKVAQELLGIDWMTWKGMYQSIPPVYTEHIGRQLLEHL